MRSKHPRLVPAPLADHLGNRVGRLFLQQRLGLEEEQERRVLGRGRTFFHPENWTSLHGLARKALAVSGLLPVGRRNALQLQIRHHEADLPGLDPRLNGFTVLHLSDLHLDVNPRYADVLVERLAEVSYDLCVLTGDYRAETMGPLDPAVELFERVAAVLRGPRYGVLGNHDSLDMVPYLERAGVHILLNESVCLEHDGAALFLAGLDDPHYYQTDNLERAGRGMPEEAFSLLLAHSPEVFRRAAHAGFDLMLCGHTHGGQVCLPGGRVLLRNAKCPRGVARGAWEHAGMRGYTSCGSGTAMVDVRFFCPPEITLHHLRRGLTPKGGPPR